MRTKFYLVGPNKGKTITLGSMGQFPFTNGVMQFDGPPDVFAKVCRAMEVNGWAYPEGHERLQPQEVADGKRDVHPSTVVDPNAGVRSDIQSDGRVEAREAGAEGTGAAGGEARSPERVPDRDGQPEGVTPPPVVPPVVEEPPAAIQRNGKLLDALAKLDVNDDSHWTSNGLPAIAVVSQFYGSGVTRATINAVSPNTTRDNVRKAHAQPE